MAADGKVVIDVILEDGKVVKGVAKVDKSLKGIGGSAKSAARSIGEIAGALGLVALASKAMNLLRDSIDGAISRYDTLNNFPRVLEQIGFSANDSRKAINKLSDGIQGLPTTLDDVAGTAQRIAVLTNDLDGAVNTTLALNNAFISSGADAANASRGLDQYVQMLSKGSVDLESWRTLQETMGVALNDVAKAFGFAGRSAQNDLYDALKDGSITFDEFNGKLIELNNQTNGFADRARTASGGIRTAFTNMKTAVVRGVTNIITAIDGFLANTSLQSIENIITNIGKSFFDTLDGMANAVDPVANAIVDLYNALKPLAPVIAGVVSGLIAFQIVTVLTPGVTALAGAIALLRNPLFLAQYGFLALNAAMRANPVGWIIGLIVGLTTVIAVLWKTNETFRDVVLSVWGSFRSAIEGIMPTLSAVGDYFVALGDSIKPFISNLKVGTINAFNSAMEWLGDTAQTVADFFGKLKESFNIKDALSALSGPLTTVAMLLLGISGPIGWLISGLTFLATKTNIFSDMIKVLKGEMDFADALDSVVDMSVGFIDNMSDMLVSAIDVGADIIVNLINGIAKNLPILVQKGTEILTKLIDSIVIALPMLIEVGTTALTTLINGFVLALPTIIEAGIMIIQTLLNTFTTMLPMLMQVGITILTTLLNTWVTMLPMLIEVGLTLLTTLINVFIENLPMIIELAITILTTLLNVLVENIPLIIDAGIQLLTALIDGLIEVLPALIDAGLQILMALINVLIDSLPMIIDAGIKILMALISGIVKIIPQLISAGINLIIQLAVAIIKALPQILAAGVQILLTLVKGIGSLISQLFKLGGELVMSVIKGIGKLFSNLLNTGKELGGKVLDGIKGIGSKFLDAGKNIVSSIADGIKSNIKKVTGAISNVTQKIRDFLPFSPAKEGALRDIMDIQLAQSVAKAIDRGKNTAVRSMASLTGAVSKEMDGLMKPDMPIGFTNKLRGITAPIGNILPSSMQVTQSVIHSQANSNRYDDSEVKGLLKQLVEKDGNLYVDGDKLGSVTDKEQARRINLTNRRVALD